MMSIERASKRLWRAGGRVAVLLVVFALTGCIASTRNPERLFPVSYEMEQMRFDQEDLFKQYQGLVISNPIPAARIRNEIITQRMYAIDVQYTQYENALTREGQEIGFGALTAATGLSTAATLVVPTVTKS